MYWEGWTKTRLYNKLYYDQQSQNTHMIYSLLYTITWSLIIRGSSPPPLGSLGDQWPPSPPGSYSTACLHKTSLFVIHTYMDMLSTHFKSENVSAKYFGVAYDSPFMLITKFRACTKLSERLEITHFQNNISLVSRV